MTENFIHLHTHSAYSLAEGAIKVKDLVDLCIKENMPAVAVTDTNNLFGAMEFAIEASKAGIQPILGCQVSINKDGNQLVLLVQNRVGYKNLCKIISNAYMQEDNNNEIISSFDIIEKHNDGLICLSGAMRGTIAQAMLHGQNDKSEEALTLLKNIFADRFYICSKCAGLPLPYRS